MKQAVESCGEASRVKVIGNRACAYITMENRRSANDVVSKMREVSVAKKMVKVYWARSPGMDSDQFSDLWDSNRGVLEIPYEKLPLDLVALCEGAMLDIESLPIEKKLLYKETGETVISIPPPNIQPPVPHPPPMGFPFQHQLTQLPGQPRPAGLPPGVPPMVIYLFNNDFCRLLYLTKLISVQSQCSTTTRNSRISTGSTTARSWSSTTTGYSTNGIRSK